MARGRASLTLPPGELLDLKKQDAAHRTPDEAHRTPTVEAGTALTRPGFIFAAGRSVRHGRSPFFGANDEDSRGVDGNVIDIGLPAGDAKVVEKADWDAH